MSQFANGFLLTLLHSLWQSALLLLIYFVISIIIKRQLPSARRNFLYILLISQLIISIVTFFIIYNETHVYEELMAVEYARMFTNQPFLQMIAPWLFYCYLIVVAYKSTVLVFTWNRFISNCRDTWQKPSVDLKLFTMVKAHEFGIIRKVSLWYSDAITTPVTFGFFKPVILMPVALLNQLTLEEAESLIVHELTHIKNNDYLLNFILIISDTVFFFNPFIRIIAGNIRLEREKNCDVQVLHFKYSSLTYAETLLKAARFKPQSRIFQLAAVSKKHQLLNRIMFFTSDKNLNFRKGNFMAATYILVFALFCINFFLLTGAKKNEATLLSKSSPVTPLFSPVSMNKMFVDESVLSIQDQGDKIGSLATKAVLPTEEELDQLIPSDEELNAISKQALEDVNLEEINYALQASYEEVPVTKEMIVDEENSGSGKSTTRAFKMVFLSGEWVAIPIWTFTETRPLTDSIIVLKDSLPRPFNIVQ